jgi:signal transduction histidine kinase
MGERMRALDWTATSFGPLDAWPQSLRSALSICLGSGFQIAIYWGRDLSLLYNDAWAPILGLKHPDALAKPGREVWPEIWSTIGPMFEQVFRTGEATRAKDSLLAMHRHGFTEECYFDYTFSPIRDEADRVGGIFNAVVETTFRVIGERRTALLRELGEALARAQTIEEVCAAAAKVLDAGDADLPFCLLYLPTDETTEFPARLAFATRVAAGGRAAPVKLSWDDTTVWPIGEARRAGEMRVVPNLATRLGGPLPGGPWPEPCATAVVLTLGTAPEVLGSLVLGVSPRLLLDTEYRAFLERVGVALTNALSRAASFEHQQQRARELADLDRAKTVFFSNVSHELRTPLTLMLGPIGDALRDAAMPSTVRAQLELAHRNSQRSLKLVNSLLDFSRIEAGRLAARFEPTDLAALTKDLASTFRGAFDRARLRLVVSCEPLDEPVYLDRDLWEKIVLNLLSNAFKFTLEGEVRVETGRDGNRALLRVADTGVGVSADELPKIFDRFHRVENSRGRTHEGTGIGLALVSELVAQHGGTIDVRSEVDRGTTFTVSVPLGSAHLPPDRIVSRPDASSPALRSRAFVDEAMRWLPDDETPQDFSATIVEPASSSHFMPAKGAKILLADDNSDMRHYVRGLLQSAYHVTAVSDGAQALQAARHENFDLVLSDVMMPELDGFGLLKALRSEPRTTTVPVILLSARAGEEATIEGYDAGADDYLIKPFSARELLARVSGAIALSRARREAAEQLRVSDERFRAVQEASHDGFIVFEALRDATGEIVDFTFAYMNAAAARMAKLDRIACLGKRLLQIHPGNGPAGLFARYVEVTNTGTPWIGEINYVHDGLDVRVRLSVARVGDGIAISTVDVSDRYRAEMALKAADQRKDEFLATLAHELRNPLAPIRQAARLARHANVTDEQRRWSNDVIDRQTRHMAMLLDDLLDLSRVTRGKLEIRKAPVDLRQIVDTAIETARPLIESHRHTLNVDLPRERIIVQVDALRIAQALANLLTNAAKYTDPGGRIDLRVCVRDGEVVMQVADDGIGIAPDEIASVFEMFSQVQSAIDRSEGGLGIGLALVKGVIELHGGHVAATSGGIGRGSEFTIAIPAEPPAGDGDRGVPGGAPMASPDRFRVLIVDDNRDAADSLSMLTQLEGHDTRVAYDGTHGLALAAEFRPDVAFLDIGMPDINGHELARRIRATEWGRGVTLVAITGWGQQQDRAAAVAAGFDQHLTKPVDFDALSKLLAARARARGGR